MTSIGPELLVELIPQLLYAVVAVAFTAVGLAAEYTSLQYLGGGELPLALWFAGLGAVLLYAGVYGLGYQKLLARVV